VMHFWVHDRSPETWPLGRVVEFVRFGVLSGLLVAAERLHQDWAQEAPSEGRVAVHCCNGVLGMVVVAAAAGWQSVGKAAVEGHGCRVFPAHERVGCSLSQALLWHGLVGEWRRRSYRLRAGCRYPRSWDGRRRRRR